MIDTPVRSFFDTTLRTTLLAQGVNVDADVSLGGQVAWPGTTFDSTQVSDDKPWFQPVYIPFEPRAAGIGTLAQNSMRGIYQIDAYGPISGSHTEQDVINLLEPICNALRRGVRFSTPDAPGVPQVCITCNQSWIFRSGRDTLTARWLVSARVKWSTYLDN